MVIFEFLEELLGEGGVEIASIIYEKESTDEEISKETGIKINTVRRVLYRMYDNRLASYRRIRDKETGWYIYYWKMELEKAPRVMRNLERDYLKNLQELLEYEKSNMFFSCPNGCNRVVFATAEENNFKCSTCNLTLDYFDNSQVIEKLEKQIKKLQSALDN